MRDTNRPPPLQPRCRPQCIVCGKPLGKVTKRRIVCRKAVCRYRFKTRAKQFEGVAHNVTENPTKSTAPKTSPSAPLSSDRLAQNAKNPHKINAKNSRKIRSSLSRCRRPRAPRSSCGWPPSEPPLGTAPSSLIGSSIADTGSKPSGPRSRPTAPSLSLTGAR